MKKNININNEHAGSTNIDIGLVPFFKKNSNIQSILDVGCGPGGNVKYFQKFGFDAYGIDGDKETLPKNSNFEYVDYRHYSSTFKGPFDLCWSVEFAEHIEEQYIDNFLMDYKKCKALIFTAAPKGWGGEGHVNEQDENYWINRLEGSGFKLNIEYTNGIRETSTLTFNGEVRRAKKQFIRNRGLFFVNTSLK